MRLTTFALITLLLGACQSMPKYQPPNGEPAQLSLKVRADFDRTWQAIIETFAASLTGIETIEKASGFVAAARAIDFSSVSNLPDLVDLGVIDKIWASSIVQARPDRASARIRYNVFVIRGDNEQEIRVNTGWEGHVQMMGMDGGGATVPVVLGLIGYSTGVFERRLLEKIAAKLSGTGTEILVTQEFRGSTYAFTPRNKGQGVEDEGWVPEK